MSEQYCKVVKLPAVEVGSGVFKHPIAIIGTGDAILARWSALAVYDCPQKCYRQARKLAKDLNETNSNINIASPNFPR